MLPNLISIGRVFLVPLVVWLIIKEQYQAAFYVFVLAGLSDAADGFLARQFHWQTELGAYLDPLADKLLLVSIFLTLGFIGHLPPWIVILVVSRDIVIVGAMLLSWMLSNPMTVSPLFVSKMNTTAQIMLAALILAELGFEFGIDRLVAMTVDVTAVLTVLSAALYLFAWLRHMTGPVDEAASAAVVSDPKRAKPKQGRSRSPVEQAHD